tara:strand:+ start:1273 stop:1782 length:510 start_codon:yes stop_codon:yes gene_type:complete
MLFDYYEVEDDKWEPLWAVTISPRRKHNDAKGLLDSQAGDYLNRVASKSGVHILPIVYKGDERVGSREHLHMTLFVERNKFVDSGCLFEIAKTHKAFRDDFMIRAIKRVYDYQGWEEYKKGKHNLTMVWASCPRKRRACRYGASKGRESCALIRSMVKRVKRRRKKIGL